MIDYHLHLWPHGHSSTPVTRSHVLQYCEAAAAHGVVEIALTEHLFRFRQFKPLLGHYFRRYPESPMRSLMEEYWHDHNTADLDQYVEEVLAAKQAGLPVVLGLEVDYYEGEMDAIGSLLAGYPFDVVLGSVHWIGPWPFDHVGDSFVQSEWDRIGVDEAWERYTRSLEELAATRSVDVLAHPDLIKVAGRWPSVPGEYYDRMAEAAATCGIAAEVSSAGLRKPVGEIYPSPQLLERFFRCGVPVTTASDAHEGRDVAHGTDAVQTLLRECGYSSVLRYRKRQSEGLLLAQHG